MRFLPLVLVPILAARAGAVRIVEEGRSDYRIVLPAGAIPAERFAAKELVLHLETMTGAKLPIVNEADVLGVLISWGESLLAGVGQKSMEKGIRSGDLALALEVFGAINTGGGGGVDE